MPNNLDYSFDKLTDLLLVFGEAQHNSHLKCICNEGF
jgi:hypothetical protein